MTSSNETQQDIAGLFRKFALFGISTRPKHFDRQVSRIEEICDIDNGCTAGISPTTNDNITCTNDSCDEINNLIIHFENNSLCSAGFVCVEGDGCNLEMPLFSEFDGNTTDFDNVPDITKIALFF